ncbi:MAG TPA: helix-turn-helix domain-containing protein [Thermoguttaceae bacterium]|nr:helix-turn-helix domain-containing protein [Thermoguttaceae bacterium]
MSVTLESPLLSRDDAAAYLGIHTQTLALWASCGRYDLPFAKIGRRAMYRKADLDEFIERRTATQTGAFD